MTSAATLSVTVVVLTYQRPDDLTELLPMLAQQRHGDGFEAEILVIDNDPAGGAAEFVGSLAPGFRYVHEGTPGIAAARNRALDEASGCDVLVFIDDDERPCPNWLHLMVQTYRRDSPVGVVGPVVSEFDVDPEPWVSTGRFFDRLRRPTGSRVDVAATNNLLLDMASLRRSGIRFDLRFGISGGSDTLFTRSVTAAFGSFVWCDEAVVLDRVPASRVTRSWVVRRAFRSGNSWSRTTVELAGSRRDRTLARLRLAATGGVRLLGGGARLAAGVLTRSMSFRARGVRTLARGAGMFTGAFGYVYSEYRRRPLARRSASR